jgi:hypothetical protein
MAGRFAGVWDGALAGDAGVCGQDRDGPLRVEGKLLLVLVSLRGTPRRRENRGRVARRRRRVLGM